MVWICAWSSSPENSSQRVLPVEREAVLGRKFTEELDRRNVRTLVEWIDPFDPEQILRGALGPFVKL